MMMPRELPEALIDESFDIKLIYNLLLAEKRRWDRFQQNQYAGVLESWLEPIIVESHHLIDPTTGAPTEGVILASAISAEGWWAEVQSKALIVSGTSEAPYLVVEADGSLSRGNGFESFER